MAAVKAIIGVYKKVIRGIFILNGGSGKVSEQETYTVTSKTSIGMSWATGQEIQVLRSSICKDHEERRTCQVQWTKERRVSLEPSEWNSEENKIKEGVEARRVSPCLRLPCPLARVLPTLAHLHPTSHPSREKWTRVIFQPHFGWNVGETSKLQSGFYWCWLTLQGILWQE